MGAFFRGRQGGAVGRGAGGAASDSERGRQEDEGGAGGHRMGKYRGPGTRGKGGTPPFTDDVPDGDRERVRRRRTRGVWLLVEAPFGRGPGVEIGRGAFELGGGEGGEGIAG